MNHYEKHWALALIDLDGTLYRGKQPITGAAQFIQRLRDRQTQPVFFTNNATRTPRQAVEKLHSFGIVADVSEVCTSSQAAAAYLKAAPHAGRPVGMMGSSGLYQALVDEGLQPMMVSDPEFAARQRDCGAAVLGLDVDAHYQTLANFSQLASRLGSWVLTNADVRLPAEDRFLPGNGALGMFVETATGIRPYVAGKPNPDFVTYALARYQVDRKDALIIGDNVATDIAAGVHAGVYTIQVTSGVSYDALESAALPPDVAANEVWPSVDSLFCDKSRA